VELIYVGEVHFLKIEKRGENAAAKKKKNENAEHQILNSNKTW